ncbi:MAG: sigma-70 family RNA polymerase sigma factor [Anaerolineaceae bacterium]|nr:sigma-70 family RNA polymerase sigma factor [Anaerolineaceae bacterium]
MHKNEDTFSSEFMGFLFKRYLPRIYRRVCAMVPQAEAEDVTREVFIALLRSLPDFQADSSFSTWVNHIIKGGIIDYYRRTSWISRPLTEQEIESAGRESDLQAADEFAGLKNQLAMLDEALREIILLRLVDGHPFSEVAQRLGIDPGEAKERYFQAISVCQKLSDEGLHDLSLFL